MQIVTSINKRNLNELVIKSTIWNSIVEIFKIEKNIDLTDNLISIVVKGHNIIIKINKPVIKFELTLLEDKIEEKIKEKFKKIGIIFQDFKLIYI